MVWSEEEDEQLTANFHAGLSASLNAANLNVVFSRSFTRNAIIGRLHRLGLKSGAKRPAHRAINVQGIARPTRITCDPPSIAKNIKALKAAAQQMRKVELPKAKAIRRATKVGQEPPLRIPLLDLTDRMCRFIVDEDPFVYCAQPKRNGSSYCCAHHKVVYVTTREAEKQRQKDAATFRKIAA